MLVQQRGGRRVVPHPSHEITEAGAGLRSQGVAGVTQVVQMKARHADRGRCRLPPNQLVEVAAPKRNTRRAGKHESSGRRINEGIQVGSNGRTDGLRKGHRAGPATASAVARASDPLG